MRTDRGALRLYAVTGRPAGVSEKEMLDRLHSALEGGVTMVQLREKNLDEDQYVSLAKRVHELCGRFGVPLIIDDQIEVALKSGADGVHLGAEDIPVEEARALGGDSLIIGATAKTVPQASEAQAQGADYLGVGAVFPSATKPDAIRTPLEKLAEICRSVQIPAVAIGGISEQNLHRLRGTGIAGIAVASALFGAEDPKECARKLLRGVDEVLAEDREKT
ncbi:MAG: thiamine phosphate synthase [Oscillospiraceae bacterium]|nr:thiamine phosphate synthase [Oscillospiraceae bacterium]